MKKLVMLSILLLAASPVIGWKTISCMGPQQENTYKVPDSCADKCAPELVALKLKELDGSYRKYYAGEYAKHKKGEPFAYPGLELCRTNEWACANGFSLKVECGENGAYRWAMEKTLGGQGIRILITPLWYVNGVHSFPGLITAAFDVDKPWPPTMTKRNERARGGYDEQVRRMIEEMSVKGIIETEIVYDVNPGPNNTTTVSERRSLKGFLYAPGLAAMVDYNEVIPFKTTFAEVEGLLRGFVAAHARDGLKLMEACAGLPANP